MLTIPDNKRVIGLVDAIEAAGYSFHWNNVENVITPSTPDEYEAAVQAIVDAYDPVADELVRAKLAKSAQVNKEAVTEVRVSFPSIVDAAALDLEVERWESFLLGSPTAKYQKLLDIQAAVKIARESVDAAASVGAVDAVVMELPGK